MKSYPNNLYLVCLFLILILGLFLRTYQLDQIPAGFFADEAANGFNAYKLLATGADEYNKPFPFYFQSFGDYRTPVAIYSMIPIVALLGLSELSVRLTMAIYGTLTILILYLAVKASLNTRGRNMQEVSGLSAALFLAVSPWHIHFSRSGFEYIPMPFFLSLSLLFFYKFITSDNKSSYLLPLSAVSFVVTFYTAYVIQLVMLPLLSLLFVIYYRSIIQVKRSTFFITATILIVGFLPFIQATLAGQALTRFQSVSPFAQGMSLESISGPIIKTYLEHFSADFLFTKGDIDMPGHFITRHSVRGMGELYLIQLPLIIFGLLFLFQNHKRFLLIIFFLIFLYPIGSTVVAEGPFSHRSLLGVIPFTILTGVGLSYLLKIMVNLKYPTILPMRFILLLSFFVVLALSINNYRDKYFREYPRYSSDYWGWQYGPREIMSYFLSQSDAYDEMYLSGEFNGADIFLKFYDPENLCQNKCRGGDSYRNSSIVDLARKQLFSLSPDYLSQSEYADKFSLKKTVYYPNGAVAFIIGEIKR